MKARHLNKFFLLFIFYVFLFSINKNVLAQKIEYSSENVFIEYPDHLQLVANIAGNHHLVKFVEKEDPSIFVFDKQLTLQAKVHIPFKFPERSEMIIIPLSNFYYIYIHPHFTQKYFLWKIEANGNFTDVSVGFQKLLQSQSHNIKLGFQLIANQDQLCMIYHTDLTNVQKSTLVIVQTDSLLTKAFEHKVSYDFNRDEERLQQEIVMFGRFLFVLKTARSGTSLELIKVNLATGYTIRNTFYSSGYFYSQSSINYNNKDSTVTVSSLLTEPRSISKPKYLVFVSRMNKILIEEAPFAVLRSQFIKNTNTNFLFVDRSKWVHLATERDPRQDIRFSLLDKNFKIINDTLVSNARSSYTIETGKFARFHANDREYMLVGQRFFRRSNGLLMVNSDGEHLIYTNIRVNDRNDYLLSKANLTPQGIIVPYIHRREAGLVRITIE